MANKITIDVEANVREDAKWILNRQERMEKQRLEFIGNLFKYTANLVLTYDEDMTKDVERKDDEQTD